ncbi:MAG: hypothetical protein RL377_453 [Bacteroidota bacterium]|jgi:hypothetical protein
MKKSIYLLFLLFSVNARAQKTNLILSTNGTVQFIANVNENGNFEYSVYYKNKPVVVNSDLAMELSKPELLLNEFILTSVDSSKVDQSWEPVWGEQNSIRNKYKQFIFHLTDKATSTYFINIIFRLFEDGVGFRYEFPKQKKLQYFILKNELTQFKMTGDHKAFWIPGDFDTNEYAYNTTKLSEIDAIEASAKEKDIAVVSLICNGAVQTPLMMKSKEGLYINIHEAALLDYPAMNLDLNRESLTFTSELVPDAVGNKAYLHAPFQTPWRTIVVSDKATDILASKMILNLNEPTKIKNTSFIHPQKFVGVWWEMHTGKATWFKEGGKHGATTENVKKYIDFAAQHKFDGVLVEGWNTGWEDWFGNWKEDVFDFVTPYSDYDVNALTKYAKAKGVKIIMHHETSGSALGYERRLDTAYRFMINHDMNTVKTGYVGKIIPRGEHHDGQWMVNHYTRVAEKTAQYNIMLDAHEPVHPTGLHRTYPNWMANEAARGAEFNNAPTLGISPEHNTILPFTRLMGGPMDYTPGLFHFQLNQFEKDRKQKVNSTLAKQLALYVTMYSPLQMAADLPENYEKHLDAFQFIKDVPVNWSDTKILEAEPGDYITIARKSKNNKDWFIGSITDENARTLNLKFDFLDPQKKYKAIIYMDAKDADYSTNPAAYAIEQKMINAQTSISIPIAKGGGCAISIFEIK